MQEELIYRGRIFEVRREKVIVDGKELLRDVVYHPGAVAMLVEHEGKFLLVEQYRHPARAKLLEIPAGTLEEGETPEQTARRELMEEAGIEPLKLRKLITFYVAPGYTSELIHLFYVDEFRKGKLEGDEDEHIRVVWMDKEEAYRRIEEGSITDAKTIIALLYYRCYLG